MKIVILQGSPNKKGSTNILAENFSQGGKGSRAQRHKVRPYGYGHPPMYRMRDMRI